ncbi:MAG: hypothetical protein QME25_08945 [Bacteroidota bacterium]|nr:hypothetical protein [Bacteroidota bacterium]
MTLEKYRTQKNKPVKCLTCHNGSKIESYTKSVHGTHKSNLAITYGSCHPGANENFTKGLVHVAMKRDEDGILDFIKKAKRQLMVRRGLIEHHKVISYEIYAMLFAYR